MKPASGKYISRPGVKAATRLIELVDDKSLWVNIEGRYNAMLEEKSGSKLAKLDQKIRKSVAGCQVQGFDGVFWDVIEWKFSKGKPRHALKPLLKSNSNEAISVAFQEAFELVSKSPKVDDDEVAEEAINRLCVLSGVGPATASAYLSFKFPDRFAFMDDEVIEALIEKKRAYTLKTCLEINKKCKELADMLSDEEDQWDRSRVGRALWTAARINASERTDPTLQREVSKKRRIHNSSSLTEVSRNKRPNKSSNV